MKERDWDTLAILNRDVRSICYITLQAYYIRTCLNTRSSSESHEDHTLSSHKAQRFSRRFFHLSNSHPSAPSSASDYSHHLMFEMLGEVRGFDSFSDEQGLTKFTYRMSIRRRLYSNISPPCRHQLRNIATRVLHSDKTPEFRSFSIKVWYQSFERGMRCSTGEQIINN